MRSFKAKILLIFISICLGCCVASAELKEGEDYAVLKEPLPNASNAVIYVFSYTCSLCYTYNSFIPYMAESVNVAIKPYYVWQMGEFGRIASQVFAVALAKDKEENRNSFRGNSAFFKAEVAYFHEFHDKKRRWSSGADFLKTGLMALDMSESKYNDMLNLGAVKRLLKEWEASYAIAAEYGVPAFVVNGKYVVINIASQKDLESKILALLKM